MGIKSEWPSVQFVAAAHVCRPKDAGINIVDTLDAIDVADPERKLHMVSGHEHGLCRLQATRVDGSRVRIGEMGRFDGLSHKEPPAKQNPRSRDRTTFTLEEDEKYLGPTTFLYDEGSGGLLLRRRPGGLRADQFARYIESYLTQPVGTLEYEAVIEPVALQRLLGKREVTEYEYTVSMDPLYAAKVAGIDLPEEVAARTLADLHGTRITIKVQGSFTHKHFLDPQAIWKSVTQWDGLPEATLERAKATDGRGKTAKHLDLIDEMTLCGASRLENGRLGPTFEAHVSVLLELWGQMKEEVRAQKKRGQ
jgi:hypothetical protein